MDFECDVVCCELVVDGDVLSGFECGWFWSIVVYVDYDIGCGFVVCEVCCDWFGICLKCVGGDWCDGGLVCGWVGWFC